MNKIVISRTIFEGRRIRAAVQPEGEAVEPEGEAVEPEGEAVEPEGGSDDTSDEGKLLIVFLLIATD